MTSADWTVIIGGYACVSWVMCMALTDAGEGFDPPSSILWQLVAGILWPLTLALGAVVIVLVIVFGPVVVLVGEIVATRRVTH